MSDKKKFVEKNIADVYFGRADCFIVGGVKFNRFGFSFDGNVRNCKFDVVNVEEEDAIVWVEFHKFGEPVVAVGIPKANITIPQN